jgi:hypothetical protein
MPGVALTKRSAPSVCRLQEKELPMRSLWLPVLFGFAVALPASASADPGTQSKLTAIAGQGTGIVKVAPTAHDLVGPDTFDVQGTVTIHDAVSNTTFTVLRRVDLNPDGVCTGTTWLMLPPPNQQTLTTSNGGAGALHFHFSRGAPFIDGVRFDVQWRLEGNDGSILQSDCFTVTVK